MNVDVLHNEHFFFFFFFFESGFVREMNRNTLVLFAVLPIHLLREGSSGETTTATILSTLFFFWQTNPHPGSHLFPSQNKIRKKKKLNKMHAPLQTHPQ